MNDSAIILVVDDDQRVLESTRNLLNQASFAEPYRVHVASSGPSALKEVQGYAHRNEEVALFLVDQRMDGMTGIEFLEVASRYFPYARRVLLTAVEGAEAASAAIEGINKVKLHKFIAKQAGDAHQKRYDTDLAALLLEWAEDSPRPFRGCRLIGQEELDSPGPSTTLKAFLAENLIPYQWLDVDADDSARLLADSIGGEAVRLPIVLFPGDEGPLIQPNEAEFLERMAVHIKPRTDVYELIVVGAGPAGMKAALFAGSEGLTTCVIEAAGVIGGRARESARVDNYLGFPIGVRGRKLMDLATQQVRRFGVEVYTPLMVDHIRVEGPDRFVGVSKGPELKCRSILLASGAKLKRLTNEDVADVESFVGKGIYYGSVTARAARFKDQDVFVVGGGNSAAQAALFLARHARRVTILVRDERGLAKETSKYLIENIERRRSHIEVREGARIEEVRGDSEGRLTGIRLKGESEFLGASAVFVFIGATPHTEYLQGVVALEKGFVLTGREIIGDDLISFRNRLAQCQGLKRQPIIEYPEEGGEPKSVYYPYWLESSVPGIFAAGDVRASIINQRITTAVGEACTAIGFVHLYLKDVCPDPPR